MKALTVFILTAMTRKNRTSGMADVWDGCLDKQTSIRILLNSNHDLTTYT